MITQRKITEIKTKIDEAEVFSPDYLSGLNDEQIQSRKDDGLVNKNKKRVTKNVWQILKDNVFSFFNIIFFGVCIMLLMGNADVKNYFFIIPIIANSALGLITDLRARALINKLNLVTNPTQSVMRNGKELSLPSDELVLNDIIVLRAGDQITADAVIVSGKASFDESSLTGESDSVTKSEGEEVLSGTYVVSGIAYAKTIRIGPANYVEGIAEAAKSFRRPKSEIKTSCLYVFRVTGTAAIILGITMILIWFLKGNVTYASYVVNVPKFAGSIVAMIPAGLYLLSSMTLGVGVVTLAKKRINVQELFCIETLARADVICFDKTGTLTDGELSIKEMFNLSSISDEEIQDSISSLVNATQDNNGTARAIRQRYTSCTLKAVAAIPFDSIKKYSAATFENGETYIIGAYGFVECKKNAEAETFVRRKASDGIRTVCVFKSKNPIKDNELPAKIELIAVLTISDHIKSDAKDNIAWFASNGVDIKIISGDDPTTVARIANEVGVPGAANFKSLEGVSLDEIPDLVDKYSVFGRVNPQQKEKVVECLQEKGHKVAMTGDGVNDILALKKADCSICMASGSPAARNSSHMIALDNDFSHLPDVVSEGRRVVNNLQRTSSLFLSKTVFAILLTVIFTISELFGGPGYPFTTSNMILWEIVTIGGGGFLLALEPSNEPIRGTFLGNVLRISGIAGICQTLSVLTVYISYMVAPEFFLDSLTVTSTVAVYVFSVLSYLALMKNCLPFNKYRIGVFAGLATFGVVFIIIDYRLYNTFGFLGNLIRVRGPGSEYLSIYHWVFIASIILVIGAIYVGANIVATKLPFKAKGVGDEN
ncbi:MAG: HAD-IC family P-type ATPase [Bacilli bacterium]|nr:HAD-IC family P-type ATPase [Bacilli bacterium]